MSHTYCIFFLPVNDSQSVKTLVVSLLRFKRNSAQQLPITKYNL